MKTTFLSIVLVGSIAGILNSNPAFAGCNAFGCSQSSVADCNAFGCPNPPMGASCTAFGCPPSPQPAPTPIIVNPNRTIGGSPEGIHKCMRGLLYKRQLVCTRNSCSQIPLEGLGGWKYQNVRTDISESAAAQACQNAR